MQTQDLVVLKSFAKPEDAAAAKWKLNSAGIQVVISGNESEEARQQLALSTPQHLLLVDGQQLTQARQVLSVLEPTVLSPGQWMCSACGETGELGFFSCWNCGAQRVGGDAEEYAQAAPQSGGCCGGGGCGSNACGPAVLSIELPADWDTAVQNNDRVADRAFRAALVGAVVPPVLLYAVALVTKSACVPLSQRGTQRFYSAFAITLGAAVAWAVVWNKFI